MLISLNWWLQPVPEEVESSLDALDRYLLLQALC